MWPEVSRPPLPPFTLETAVTKVRMAEDAWNTRDPACVALAYTPDSRWRNRAEFLEGRAAIEAFLQRKWARELNYRLIKELWAFQENPIAVRLAYEWHDVDGHWFRSYGNENWEFDEAGLMRRRIASINDARILAGERKFVRPLGPARSATPRSATWDCELIKQDRAAHRRRRVAACGRRSEIEAARQPRRQRTILASISASISASLRPTSRSTSRLC
jgi:nuclear transport factor 2 (NTF2) superfamily protein